MIKKICEVCGKEFETNRKEQKYCSSWCGHVRAKLLYVEGVLLKEEAKSQRSINNVLKSALENYPSTVYEKLKQELVLKESERIEALQNLYQEKYKKEILFYRNNLGNKKEGTLLSCLILDRKTEPLETGAQENSMQERKCIICGKEFTPIYEEQQCCDWECFRKVPEKEKDENGYKECACCGKLFKPVTTGQRYCNYKCEQKVRKLAAKWHNKNKRTGLNLRLCPVCGKEFTPNVHNQKYCSVVCRTESKRIKDKEVKRTNMLKEDLAGVKKVKICPVCGKEFTPGKRYQKYCSKECKKRESYRRHSLSGFIKGDTKVCPVCGKEFIANVGDQKYCSEECRRISGNKKHSLSGFTKGDTKICPVCGKKFTLTLGTQKYCSRECSSKFQSKKRNKSGAAKGDTKVCPVCGKEFIASTGRQKYCSVECSNKFWSRKTSKLGTFKGDTKICPGCGKEFTINKGNQKYCSRECSVKSWNKIKNVSGFAKGDTKICPVCGKEFITNAGNQKYCSRECSNKFWHEKVKRELLESNTGKAQGNLGAETSIKEVLASQESTWITCAPQEVIKEEVIIEKRKCIYCGKEFIPETEDQEYCSLECRVKKFTEYERTHRYYILPSGIKQIPLIYKYENGLVEGKEFEERTCIVCGKKFKPLFKNQRWCSWNCKKEIPEVPFKPGEKRECLFCGKEFTMSNHNQKYCSVECSSASHDLVAMYYNALWLEKEVTENDRLCSKCGEKFTPRTSRQFCCSKCEGIKEEVSTPILELKKVKEQKECAFCGKEFIPKTDNQKYCSRECSKRMNKIRARERERIKEEYEVKEKERRKNKKVSFFNRIKMFFSKPEKDDIMKELEKEMEF